MEWILYVLLALAVAGDILLAVILAKVLQKNNVNPRGNLLWTHLKSN